MTTRGDRAVGHVSAPSASGENGILRRILPLFRERKQGRDLACLGCVIFYFSDEQYLASEQGILLFREHEEVRDLACFGSVLFHKRTCFRKVEDGNKL